MKQKIVLIDGIFKLNSYPSLVPSILVYLPFLSLFIFVINNYKININDVTENNSCIINQKINFNGGRK